MDQDSSTAEGDRERVGRLRCFRRGERTENGMMKVFHQLLSAGSFVDVNLLCYEEEEEEGKDRGGGREGAGDGDGSGGGGKWISLRAHRLVLSACSPVFRRLLSAHDPSTSTSTSGGGGGGGECGTLVVMPSEVRAADLEDVLAFVYRGWAQVPEERRAGVVAAARALEIQGITMETLSGRQQEQQQQQQQQNGGGGGVGSSSRESSLDLDGEAQQQQQQSQRPSSQLSSHSSSHKRKSSPRFRFTSKAASNNNATSSAASTSPAAGSAGRKRKSHKPTRLGEDAEGGSKAAAVLKELRKTRRSEEEEEAELDAEMEEEEEEEEVDDDDEAQCDAEVRAATERRGRKESSRNSRADSFAVNGRRLNGAKDEEEEIQPVDFTIKKVANTSDQPPQPNPPTKQQARPRRRGRPPHLSPTQLEFLSRRQVEIFAHDGEGGPPTMICGPSTQPTSAAVVSAATPATSASSVDAAAAAAAAAMAAITAAASSFSTTPQTSQAQSLGNNGGSSNHLSSFYEAAIASFATDRPVFPGAMPSDTAAATAAAAAAALQQQQQQLPSDNQEENGGAEGRAVGEDDDDEMEDLDVDGGCDSPSSGSGKAPYTKRDLGRALDALRSKKMSLSKASEVFGIPATTLWQRANRAGISTPKKETSNKTWSEEDLENALHALRKKEISANKAAKRFGIPSSTLYKIARKEGIELAQPFNAQQTTWSPLDLNRALESIRRGMPVQRAASEFGIPSGTLYGRCKKVGIELSKAAAVHWSEDDMTRALDSVKEGGMSINQAAIHHNLPYSSLYGRINSRLKKDAPGEWGSFPTDYSLETFMAQHQQQLSASAGAAATSTEEQQQQQQQAAAVAAAAAAAAAAFPHPLPLGLMAPPPLSSTEASSSSSSSSPHKQRRPSRETKK